MMHNPQFERLFTKKVEMNNSDAKTMNSANSAYSKFMAIQEILSQEYPYQPKERLIRILFNHRLH